MSEELKTLLYELSWDDAVKYLEEIMEDHPENVIEEEKTTKQMMKELSKIGWHEYYGDSCYHQSWVDKGIAYDRAAAPIKDVYESMKKQGEINE
jgi:hypothetical protein